jgi:hypothetical protein
MARRRRLVVRALNAHLRALRDGGREDEMEEALEEWWTFLVQNADPV